MSKRSFAIASVHRARRAESSRKLFARECFLSEISNGTSSPRNMFSKSVLSIRPREFLSPQCYVTKCFSAPVHDVKSPSPIHRGRMYTRLRKSSRVLANFGTSRSGMHGNRSRKISLARLCDSGASHFNLAKLVIKFHAAYRTIDSAMASEFE